TRLAIYGRRQSSGEHRLNSGYFAVRALLIPGDQIQDAWSEIQSAVAAGNVWTVSKSAGYPVLFLTCNDGKVEWRQI
ncbi:hypothetical protein KKE28_01080, partial [Patescibacteria group bacterium]|nr:hypothetical protein [Patescibacteria group bacterium]